MERLACPLLCFLVIGCSSASRSGSAAFEACRDVLEAQAAAWNRGDLDAFADGYQRSPEIVFAGVSGVTLGWEDMLSRYRTGYPDREVMGRLEFSELDFQAMSPDVVNVRGAWRLFRSADEPHGRFLLVMREFAGGWKIVLDFTTSDDR
jgi:ketosteroid isomerase-like protein